MKKLLMTTAMVAIAAIANASSFDWKLQTGETYTGMNVYSLTGTSAASVLAACSSTDSTNWDSTFAGLTSSTVTGTGNRASASGSNDGIAAGDNVVFVIVDGAVAEGSKYWVVNDYTILAANVYDPPATGSRATVNFGTQGTAGSGTFAAPEPTSGLLLLLGMAGLALKRKRA